MTNYMRHIVAGFLIEYLNIDWRHGELWFHDTLIDADVAIQAMMWQNGGHSGMDQWNFVMHPVFAAKACDPDGAPRAVGQSETRTGHGP
jgi:deoxyribodipyrimidine photo-lyase